MAKMNYAVQIVNNDEVNVLMEDGGVVSLYRNEDDGHWVSIYYQNRPTLFDKFMWYELDEGKQYMKDWTETDLMPRMIMDALEWLRPTDVLFNKVDTLYLMRTYNERNKVETDKDAALVGAKALIEARSGRKVNMIEFEDGSFLRYNVVFDGMDTSLYFNLKEDMVLVV
jgi:hypothetical protein